MNTTLPLSVAQPRVWIGLDVSKATLDACLLRPVGRKHYKQFPNSTTGYAQLLRWVKHLAPDVIYHFCLEATGPYSIAVAEWLAEADQFVSVINPARIRFFALARSQGNKTDRADAHLIAWYCCTQTPPLWRAATPELRLLVGLVRRLRAVQSLLVQEKNRLAVPHQPCEVMDSIETTITFLEGEVERLRRQLRDHVATHETVKHDIELLQSIPGVGEGSAWSILAELPDIHQFPTAQAVAAYAGLAPREHRSGSSVHKQTRLSKRGNTHLRKAMYFPAVTAVGWNPIVKAHYQRLRQAGKAKMVALAAAMRKLLMICYGVLKHQQPFQPNWSACSQRPHPAVAPA